MKNDNLAIISNEKTQQKSNKFLCDNIDLKSIPEGLSEYFDIELFLRKSKIDRESHEINLKKIFLSSGILSFLYKIWSRSRIHKKHLFEFPIISWTVLSSLAKKNLKIDK